MLTKFFFCVILVKKNWDNSEPWFFAGKDLLHVTTRAWSNVIDMWYRYSDPCYKWRNKLLIQIYIDRVCDELGQFFFLLWCFFFHVCVLEKLINVGGTVSLYDLRANSKEQQMPLLHSPLRQTWPRDAEWWCWESEMNCHFCERDWCLCLSEQRRKRHESELSHDHDLSTYECPNTRPTPTKTATQ